MQALTIDFNKELNKQHKVESFLLSCKKNRFLFGFLPKEININYYSIAINNIKIPDELEVTDPSKLVRLQFLENNREIENATLQNFKIKAKEIVLNVIFDEVYIIDCHSKSHHFSGTISFDVDFMPKGKGAAKKHHIALEVNCLRAESEPSYQLVVHDEFLQGKEYRGATDVEIGYLRLKCQSSFNFSKSLDKCTMSVGLDHPALKDRVYFKEIDLQGGDAVYSPDHTKATIHHLLSNKELRIPILADFSKLENPSEKIHIDGKLFLEYLKNNITRARSEDFTLALTPDLKEAALFVDISEGGAFRRLRAKEIIPERYLWKGKGKSGRTHCFTICLGNIAESGDGFIDIQDFSIEFLLNKKSTSPIVDVGGDMVAGGTPGGNLNAFFQVNEKHPGHLPKMISLPNQVGGAKDFEISFQHDALGAIPKDIATIDCRISFKYAISSGRSGEPDGGKATVPFASEIIFKLEKYSGNFWLALDFGTSATVAAYTDGASITREKEDDLLVNLQTPLSRYVDEYEKEAINEKNSPFLSSEILLRPNNGKGKALVQSTNYHDDIVQLSPTIKKASKNLHLKIPFLKSLIGMDTIPVYFQKLNDYEYYLNSRGEKYRFGDKPIQVSTILANTYKSLVRDFIIPQIGDHGQLNKIIISVPNTFTPIHLNLIKNLILEKFQNFRKDYIFFISESDAVACNYLMNWEDYNFGRPAELKRKDTEYVLVYDIGAGTTDLTYFSIKQHRGGKKEVEILGRLGKTTAGNYLDYKIAEIIDHLFEAEDKRFNFTLPTDESRSVANDLKIFIRNYIKPRLANQEEFRVFIEPQSGRISEDFESGFIEFDCAQILDHNLMKQYLKKNSENLISDFFQLFHTLPGQAKRLTKGNVPIDTVIFTGRTIQFQLLQDNIKECITAWSKFPVFFTPVTDAKNLKNVVVKGALQYAYRFRKKSSVVNFKNRNLLARYGIVYTDPETLKPTFKEFLNPSTQPLDNTPKKVDGLTIYEYDTDVHNALEGDRPFINLSATAAGFFVQSFSPQTAKDAIDQNWEYITKMFEFDPDVVASSYDIDKVKVRVVINEENVMKVYIGREADGLNSPLRMNLDDNQAFKKSMWPYL